VIFNYLLSEKNKYQTPIYVLWTGFSFDLHSSYSLFFLVYMFKLFCPNLYFNYSNNLHCYLSFSLLLIGSMDPYVVIQYNGQERRSSVAKGEFYYS